MMKRQDNTLTHKSIMTTALKEILCTSLPQWLQNHCPTEQDLKDAHPFYDNNEDENATNDDSSANLSDNEEVEYPPTVLNHNVLSNNNSQEIISLWKKPLKQNIPVSQNTTYSSTKITFK